MREYKNKHFLAYLNIIADIVTQGQQQGVFRYELKPELCARIIFGSLDELSTYLVTAKRKRFDVHEVATLVGNSFLNGLVKGNI
jgi:TetR/AcrR family fatty acid metabolism transcriptional regulator